LDVTSADVICLAFLEHMYFVWVLQNQRVIDVAFVWVLQNQWVVEVADYGAHALQ
jgi:hypothetical protein